MCSSAKLAAYRRQEQEQSTELQFRNTAWAYRVGIRKAKAQYELKLARDVKGNKRSFY